MQLYFGGFILNWYFFANTFCGVTVSKCWYL